MKDSARYSLASRAIYLALWPVVRLFLHIFFRLKVTGSEHERRKGRVIYASNHISAWDPPVIGAAVHRELMYLAKRELFRIPLFRRLIWTLHARPVDRRGYSRGALEVMRARLEQDGAVLIFPEGTRQRHGKLGEGKIGVGMLAVWTGAPVIPVYISGTAHPLKAFFGRTRFRVALGSAIEAPTVATPAERKRAYQEVTDRVMAAIAQLKAAVDREEVHHSSTAQTAQTAAGDSAP